MCLWVNTSHTSGLAVSVYQKQTDSHPSCWSIVESGIKYNSIVRNREIIGTIKWLHSNEYRNIERETEQNLHEVKGTDQFSEIFSSVLSMT